MSSLNALANAFIADAPYRRRYNVLIGVDIECDSVAKTRAEVDYLIRNYDERLHFDRYIITMYE